MSDAQQQTEPAKTPRKRSFRERLLSVRPSDIVTLVILCVVAGLVLAALRVDPAELWVDFFGTLAAAWDRFFDIIADSARHAINYFLLGAILVVPIWIVWRLIRALQR
jgi:ABC-type sulfate transport system permease subunit